MSESDWKEEREELLTRLQAAERLRAESQAEAAVYLESLRDCYEAAEQALASKRFELLNEITGKLTFGMPSKAEGEQLGRYFLDAYIRDAKWLQDTKDALEKIKADAEKLPEESDLSSELKRRIIEAAAKGLVEHV